MRALTDAGAQVVQTYAADEYGLPTASGGSRRQPVQWAGEERDEQGLVFLRARSYEPATGRFLQADPLRQSGPGVGGWNRYSYAGNNPVTFTDPSGLYPYRYEWYIGPSERIGTPEAVMAYVQQHPREIFPFELGACDTITLGARCDLRPIPLDPTVRPVEVTARDPTSFTFTALEGHFDPPGSTIRFTVFEREGAIRLEQKARALREDEGSPFERALTVGAWFTWWQQAANLTRAVDPSYQRLPPYQGP